MLLKKASTRLMLCLALLMAMLTFATCALAAGEYSVTFINPNGTVAAVKYATAGDSVIPPGDTWSAADCTNITGHAIVTPTVSPDEGLTHLGVMLNGKFFRVRTVSTGSYKDDGDWYDGLLKTNVYLDFAGSSYTWDTNTWRYGATASTISKYLDEGYKESYAHFGGLGDKEIAYVIPYNSANPTQFNYYTVTFVYPDANGNTVADTQVVKHGGSATPPTVSSAYSSWNWSSSYTNVTAQKIVTLQPSNASYYFITWLNDDGTTLHTQKVPADTVPVYNGPNLSGREDDGYVYSFVGWTPSVTAATTSQTYTAVFNTVPKTYKLTLKYMCNDYLIESEVIELQHGQSYTYDRGKAIKNYTPLYTDMATVTIDGKDATYIIGYKENYVDLLLYGKLDDQWVELPADNSSGQDIRWVFYEGKWGVCNYPDSFNTYRPSYSYEGYTGYLSRDNASTWLLGPSLDTMTACLGSSFTDYQGTDLTYNEVLIDVDDTAAAYYMMPGDAIFYTVTFHYPSDLSDPASAMTSKKVIARKGSTAKAPVTAEGWGWDNNDYVNVQGPCETTLVPATTVPFPTVTTPLTYNGQEQTAIEDNEYYILSGHKATVPGTYTATISLAPGCAWPSGHSAPITRDYVINKAHVTITGAGASLPYNGQEQTATGITATGLVEGHTVSGVTWSVSGTQANQYYNATPAGTPVFRDANGVDVSAYYTYIIKNASLYISQLSLSNADVSISVADCTYTGSAHTPAIAVIANGLNLLPDTDYTVKYADNVNAGMATVTVSGKGNFWSSAKAEFRILPKQLAGATLTVQPCYETREGLFPVVSLVLDGVTLVEGVDYTMICTDNHGVGSIVVSGIGNYTGTVSGIFEIIKLIKMHLPASLREIHAEAFHNTRMKAVEIPAGCREIHAGAFKACTMLEAVYIPVADMIIADDAFADTQVTIIAPAGGTVEAWAKANGHPFQPQ